ncbi:MAG: Maf family protein [Brevefilum sp.]|jgi:septum formation protein
MKNFILASNSPRRRDLFSLFGWPFIVIPADIDEYRTEGETPVAYVQRLASEKARLVAENHAGLVIAADTIVVDGDELLGKPADDEDARRMLKQLRGRIHQVYTGIAILETETGKFFSGVRCTDVPMRDYSDAEIESYIATGDPQDKAGAYAIQHAGFHPVENLSGCYASVMGLPICLLSAGLMKFGVAIPADLPARCQEALGSTCPYLSQVAGST